MKGEGIVNIVMLIFCVVMLYAVERLPVPAATDELGPAFYPRLIVYAIIFFNVLQLIVLFFTKAKNKGGKIEFHFGRFLIMVAIMTAYVFSLSHIDYKIGTFLLILSLMVLLGVKSYKLLLSVSVLAVGAIFLFFEILLNVHIS